MNRAKLTFPLILRLVMPYVLKTLKLFVEVNPELPEYLVAPINAVGDVDVCPRSRLVAK